MHRIRKYVKVTEYILTLYVVFEFLSIYSDLKLIGTPEFDASKWLDANQYYIDPICYGMLILLVILLLHFALYIFTFFKNRH